MRVPRNVGRFLSTTIFVLLASVPAARAEVSPGLRGGLSVDPDQFLIGGHLELSPIATNLHIVPSGELGFGDDLFTAAFNGDLQYRFPVDGGVRPYAGGGLSLYFVDSDRGGSDSELGVTVLGGIHFGRDSSRPMFFEMKAGLTDEVPDWKFIFGITFR